MFYPAQNDIGNIPDTSGKTFFWYTFHGHVFFSEKVCFLIILEIHILVNICLNDTFVIDLIRILVNICLNDTFGIDLINILVHICLNDTFVIDLLHILVNICLNDTFCKYFDSIFVNICLNDTFVIDLIRIIVNICLNGTAGVGGLPPPHPPGLGRLLTAGYLVGGLPPPHTPRPRAVTDGRRPAAGSRCRHGRSSVGPPLSPQ